MNSVDYIKGVLKRRGASETAKIKLKKAGPHQPAFLILNTKQEFNTEYYKLAKWLCGCPIRSALFCYTCLVTGNPSSGVWFHGVIDVQKFKKLKSKVEEHQTSKTHLVNSLDYALLGSNISERNEEWSASVIQHNEKVGERRQILNRLINCVKDEIMMDFVEEMSRILKESSLGVVSEESICDELLESIHAVCVDLIHKEIEQTDYVSIELDEVTESGSEELIFIVRYESHGLIHERFLNIVGKLENLSTLILQQCENLGIDDTPKKLLSYSHDGLGLCYANNHREHGTITSLYERAKFIHSYACKFNLIIQRAACTYRESKVFFANLTNFSDFFSRERFISMLDKSVEKRLLRGTKIKWNFDTQSAFIVLLHRENIRECLDQIIEEEIDRPIIAKAVTLKALLDDADFNFWLDFFNKVLPHCDRLFDQLLSHEGCHVMKVRQYVELLKGHITNIERGIDFQLGNHPDSAPLPNKRQCKENVTIKEEITIEEVDLSLVKKEVSEGVVDEPVIKERRRNEVAKAVCGKIISTVEDCFTYTDHLKMAALLQSSFFPTYETCLPKLEIVKAAESYELNLTFLSNELHTVYNRKELSNVEGALVLLQYFYRNKLTSIFPETFKLLKIICTMPMLTSEPDRCFSTLARVKEVIGRSRQSRNVAAFVMCSLQKELMLRTPEFNHLVIKDFCRRNNRDAEFEFKRVC